MSNRMSVLSRRLEHFAVGFAVATFSFFLVGLFASANAKGQLVLFCAGLSSACLFASFFLWLAHGFAWAMIPEKPAETMRPAEETRPAEQIRPAAEKKPAEAMKPAEETRPAEQIRPTEQIRPAEEKRPAEAMKPAEEKVAVPVDPPDAKYTITGKRIY
jgi:hypothetical protein